MSFFLYKTVVVVDVGWVEGGECVFCYVNGRDVVKSIR